MRLSAQLKAWIVENTDVKTDAGDDDFRKAVSDALIEGTLATEKYAELTREPEDEEVAEFNKRLDGIASGLEKLTEVLTKKEKVEDEKTEEELAAEKKVADEKAEAKKKIKDGKPEKGIVSALEKTVIGIGMDAPEADEEEKGFGVRVKEAAEMYDSTTKAMTYPMQTKEGRPHPMAGRPVVDFSEKSRTIDEPSERSKAVAGVFAKLLCATAARGGSRTFGFQSLPQHDKELLCYALENEKWGGCGPDNRDQRFADIIDRKLTPREQKAIIDDATSGGTEAAPIVFDDQVIQAPLLHGELYPLINVVPLDRGRRIEGVSVGTVTSSWGGVDDTAVTLFTTTSFVSAFDTTIYRWEGSIKIGLDFLSDTPIDFGQLVTQQYGERLLEDLDNVIADGNGTDRPEGIMQKTGATSVSWGGSTSIGNYESMRFSISKAEHRANVKASAVFCGNETSYQRMKALNVGSADARRLFGGGSTNVGTYDDYSMMGRPYKINETLDNTEVFYTILARYRMHRRRGLVIRTTTEGATLTLDNEMLMIALARYGGQLERGACAAVTTTAPA